MLTPLTRRGLSQGLAALVFCASPDAARAMQILPEIQGDPVYIGQAMVTGTDNRDRPRGLALCLREVLIKASGDPNIIHAKNVTALSAQSMVSAISYWDRMSSMHKHDEQGTRDRPFILTALFDKSKIAAALEQLGSKTWTGNRPTVFLSTDVHAYAGEYALVGGPTTGYDQPELMRAAISDSSSQTALKVQLPSRAGSLPPPNTFPVTGSLVWSDAAFGWIATWHASHVGHSFTWSVRGVSFDDAFDSALTGALGVASGHDPPSAG